MKLLSLAATPAAGTIPTSLIDLKTASESDGSDYANQGRYIYRDVAIPVGTKHFVFYGKATGTETTTTNPDKLFEYGYLSDNSLAGPTAKNLDDTYFTLLKINDNNIDLSNAVEGTSDNFGKVLKALNDVTKTNVTNGTTTIEWNNITITSGSDLKLAQAQKLWEDFSKLKAGSANSVRITLNNLKSSAGVTALGTGETATIDADGLLKTLVKNIEAALTTLGDGNTFPADLYLPDGAVGVNYEK